MFESDIIVTLHIEPISTQDLAVHVNRFKVDMFIYRVRIYVCREVNSVKLDY